MHARFRSPVHRLLPFLCLAIFAAHTAFAADAPKKGAAADAAKAQQDAAMAEMMKISAPGPMHALLGTLAGNWKTSVKTWMGPEPTLSEGTCERTMIMGGRYLESKYTGDMMGMPFEGMEILTYDNMKKQFTSMWIDNMAPMLTFGSDGQVDASGKVLTIHTSVPDPQTGKTEPFTYVTTIMDKDHNTFVMNGTKDGKSYKVMEINYTRVQ